ncbi:MAG TPA: PQQ-binding-like beta-propeller repeat protein, partial [Armatimonadota bacterium]|nr:PQQ-binding-like beta-propeller repeat protein [Armatimonadota bacterium]
ERELALQTAWIEADLDAQPQSRPIIIVTHQPPGNAQLDAWLDRHNIVGVMYGHWHVINECGHRGAVYLDTGPMRGSDWGAFSRCFRVVSVDGGHLTSEVRVCGQVQRLDVVAPQGTVGRGLAPVQVKAYDTVRRVRSVTCEVSAGGQTTAVPLRQTGYHTWEGVWDAGAAPAGEVTISVSATDEEGRSWQRQTIAQLQDAPTPPVRLGDDWPGVFRADHSRVREQPLGDGLQLAWAVNTGGRCQKGVSPIIYGGRVYVGVDDKEVGHPGAGVSCFDPADGRLIWHAATDASVCSAPAAADGAVYAVSSLGTCYALNAGTGEELWRCEAFGPPSGHRLVECSPVIAGDEILLMGDSGVCHVLDRRSGQPTREIRFGGSLVYFSVPTVSEGRAYAGLQKAATALDLRTGEQIWTTAISSGKISSAPVPWRGRLYVNAATLSCLDERTGERLWQQAVPTSGNGISVAVPAGDVVLAHGVSLHAFVAETGEVRWRCEFPGEPDAENSNQRQVMAGQSTPAVAGDVAWVGHDDGCIYGVALADGAIRWRYQVGVPVKGSPIISGNTLLVCDWDGNLYCFVAPGD